MLPTIFASATPAGRSALSVLRIAGPESLNIMGQLAPKKQFLPRMAKLARIYGPQPGKSLLDEALVLYFPKPHSYTGEDIVELYLHGSPVVSRAVQSAILATKLARYAEPGEFTRRAFENGRMDLTQVEGIRDLLAAETEMQRESAIGGAAGQLSAIIENWRSEIVNASAMLTAAIDFAEDQGLGDEFQRVRSDVARVRSQVESALQRSAVCSEIVKSGIRVALLGIPNAGKSSLTNSLVQRSASIVSDVPGTTRDVLEVALEVRGHKLVLLDTAGIRESEDKVEQLGISRAREVLESAHIVIALLPYGGDEASLSEVLKETEKLAQCGQRVIYVNSKSDLGGSAPHDSGINLSSKTGDGVDLLLDALVQKADALLERGEAPLKTTDIASGLSTRARGLLETEALPGLTNCVALLESNDYVLADAELQRAANAVGLITGRGISVNEVLDVVFGEFCIGK